MGDRDTMPERYRPFAILNRFRCGLELGSDSKVIEAMRYVVSNFDSASLLLYWVCHNNSNAQFFFSISQDMLAYSNFEFYNKIVRLCLLVQIIRVLQSCFLTLMEA